MSLISHTYKITLAAFAIALFFFSPKEALGQKFAYIDSDYVLLHMPDYASAQQELNTYAIEWQAEIEAKLDAADRLEVAYRAERVLLTKEMRQKREQEIIEKRAEAKEMQKQKFGVEGELFEKRQELIEPIQQLIFEELKDISGGSGYMVIFDKSNQSNMLYTNPKYDVSDRLIKKLGYVPGEMIDVKKEEGDGGVVGKGRDAVDGARDSVRDAGRSTMERARGGTNGGAKGEKH